MLDEVLQEFPDLSVGDNVTCFANALEQKYGTKGTARFGPKTKAFVDYLNSPGFIAFLQELTGIKEPLTPDHDFMGGGLHEITIYLLVSKQK